MDRSEIGNQECEVLVVGGGPVGLALAVELGLRGIRTVVVEQNRAPATQPRAKTTNVRTMEHMRRWGIADRLRASAPLPADYPTDVRFRTRLFGPELARFADAFNGGRGRNELYSEPAQWIPQYRVEAALQARAQELPCVSFRPGARLEQLEPSDTGVTAMMTDVATGQVLVLKAGYLVGADGARSTVRARLGIEMQGQHAYAHNYNYVIRAPGLDAVAAAAPAIMYWLVNPDCAGVTGPMDGRDIWYFGFAHPGDAPPPDETTVKARMCRAFGRELPIEILVTDRWAAHSLIAGRYRSGRVFLAGDACHLHPPFGGYGMNLGIGDGVDLGWKLAATLQGWGGAELLDGYEAERRPVHQRVVAEAVKNYAHLSGDFLQDALEQPGAAGDAARRETGRRILAAKAREFHTLGVVLGYDYGGSALLVPDGSAADAPEVADYRPSARPGRLAPHLWLADGRSLYDQFGPGFTLLVTSADDSDDGVDGIGDAVDRLAAAARATGLPLTVIRPGDARLPGLYAARLVLIRPDQHVAWRADRLEDDPRHILDAVRGAPTATARRQVA